MPAFTKPDTHCSAASDPNGISSSMAPSPAAAFLGAMAGAPTPPPPPPLPKKLAWRATGAIEYTPNHHTGPRNESSKTHGKFKGPMTSQTTRERL